MHNRAITNKTALIRPAASNLALSLPISAGVLIQEVYNLNG